MNKLSYYTFYPYVFIALMHLLYVQKATAQTKIEGWVPVVDAGGDTLKYNVESFYTSPDGKLIMNCGTFGVKEWNDTAVLDVDSAVRTLPSFGLANLCADSKGNYYGGAHYDVATSKWSVVKWNGKSWKWVTDTGGSILECWYDIFSVCTDKRDQLYVSTVDKISSSSYIAVFNGSTWSRIDTVGNIFDGYCKVLLRGDDDSSIYAATDFFKDGLRGVARWDGHKWTRLGYLNASGTISCLAKDELGNLYAGGNLLDDLGRTCVARWDGSSWTYVGAGTLDAYPGSRSVLDLYCDKDNNLYAGGTFVDTKLKVFVAKWDGSVWNHLGTEPATLSSVGGTSAGITSIGAAKGTLYVSGEFKNTVTKVASLAKYNTGISLAAEGHAYNTAKISLFPNPATNSVKIELTGIMDKELELQIRSVDGKVLERKTVTLHPRNAQSSVAVDHLSSGTYLILLTGTDTRWHSILQIAR